MAKQITDHSERGRKAFESYQKTNGPRTRVADLLTDLMHHCDQQGINFTGEYSLAKSRFKDEEAPSDMPEFPADVFSIPGQYPTPPKVPVNFVRAEHGNLQVGDLLWRLSEKKWITVDVSGGQPVRGFWCVAREIPARPAPATPAKPAPKKR